MAETNPTPATAADAAVQVSGDINRVFVNTPYKEYPRHVHAVNDKGDAISLIVENDEARDAALEAGWELQPVSAGGPEAKADTSSDAKPAKKAKKKAAAPADQS